MDPFSLDHIFPMRSRYPVTFASLPQLPRSGLSRRPPYAVAFVLRDIRALRSLTLRLSGANGQTQRFFFFFPSLELSKSTQLQCAQFWLAALKRRSSHSGGMGT